MMAPRIVQGRWFKLVAIVTLILGLFLSVGYIRERTMHAIPEGLTRFELTDPLPECSRWKQHMPKTRDLDTYRLYIAARKHWRSKIEWELTRDEATRILVDVRHAAERGDWGALALMAYFYREGLGPLPTNNVQKPDAEKAVEISRRAVAAGQPWGFYDLGVAHEYGYGGAIYDVNIAWAYFLKAAKLGSPDAQLALADAYRDARRFDDEKRMLDCALAQGHGPAAYRLGMSAEAEGHLKKAILLYQVGVKFGSKDSASALGLLFGRGHWRTSSENEKRALKELGVTMDLERMRRYDEIYDVLAINPDLRLTLLDQFLPLPPTTLPAWKGVDSAAEPEPQGAPRY